ncbi:hypothetical protein EVAR_34191_1 [Eumeta japonica]|uniref:Uncharacterized protein n=1 Tax=Eumeta variegata TaxID=151549 RepID=A0A4C1WI14_EUMVA|nr:hypothetical protein EVAR_34191_1 [Eumeta japonica]
MKQRLLQLNLFLSEWKGRVPFTFLCLSLSLLGGLTMPEWKGRVPLTRSHCERITRETTTRGRKLVYVERGGGGAGGPELHRARVRLHGSNKERKARNWTNIELEAFYSLAHFGLFQELSYQLKKNIANGESIVS